MSAREYAAYPSAPGTGPLPQPAFATKILATGPGGNVFELAVSAMRLMRRLKIPEMDIQALRSRCNASARYDEACCEIEQWFCLYRVALIPDAVSLLLVAPSGIVSMKSLFWVYPARPVDREEREFAASPVTYTALKRVLDPFFFGRHWEHVTVLYEGRRADMFVDELGILDDLPRNDAATAIYRANWLSQHPDDDPESLPYIAGVAILFEKIVWT